MPEITDALIIRTVQTRRMMQAGLDYWRQGRVRQLTHAPRTDEVRALVKGGPAAPYDVQLQFRGSGPTLRVVGFCTCPVGDGCKHVAAALFALRADHDPPQGKEVPSRLHTPTLCPSPSRSG